MLTRLKLLNQVLIIVLSSADLGLLLLNLAEGSSIGSLKEVRARCEARATARPQPLVVFFAADVVWLEIAVPSCGDHVSFLT